MTTNEINKILLYAENEKHISLEMLEELIPLKTSDLKEIIQATFTGDLPRLEKALFRLEKQDLQPIRLARTLARHLHLLARAQDLLKEGKSIQEVIRSLNIFWKEQESFRQQLRHWGNNPKLPSLFINLSEFEKDCFSPTYAPMTHTLLCRFLFTIATSSVSNRTTTQPRTSS